MVRKVVPCSRCGKRILSFSVRIGSVFFCQRCESNEDRPRELGRKTPVVVCGEGDNNDERERGAKRRQSWSSSTKSPGSCPGHNEAVAQSHDFPATKANREEEEEISDPGESDDENHFTLEQFSVSVLGTEKPLTQTTSHTHSCHMPNQPHQVRQSSSVGELSTPLAARQQQSEKQRTSTPSCVELANRRSSFATSGSSTDTTTVANECSLVQKVVAPVSSTTRVDEAPLVFSYHPPLDTFKRTRISHDMPPSSRSGRSQLNRVVLDLCHDDDNPVSVTCDSRLQRDDKLAPTETDDMLPESNRDIDRSTSQQSPSLTCTPDKDVCFICGANLRKLSGFKGRLNHIKRCSKKHGVSGRDVRIDDDLESFVDTTKPGVSTSSQNPYYAGNTKWHGGTNTESAVETTTKQTTMTAFLAPAAAPPVRSLNTVLLANARKMASMNGDKSQTNTKPMSNNRAAGRKRQRGGRLGNATYSCPNYKRIPGTDFICDGFHYAKPSVSKHYFLTHFHSDHYGGINKSWNHGVIYCSLPTANLVHQQLGVDKKYLHPLPMTTPTVVTSGNGRPVSVTLFDANHCPGAVMFLFEIGKRRILHVGDFRWNREIMLENHALRSFSSLQVRLNELFLDTTYCDPKYDLPTQAQAIEAAVETVLREMEHARRTRQRVLFLFGAYTIGKERIYLSVADRLDCKVYVERPRYRILSALEWPKEVMSRFTTVKEETNLWVVPLGHINFKRMPEYVGSKNTKVFGKRRLYDRVVGFRPTGWALTAANKQGGGIISIQKNGPFTVCGVPYSEHSSFPELVDCIATLKPVKIVPTVSATTSQAQVDMLLDALRNKQRESLLVASAPSTG